MSCSDDLTTADLSSGVVAASVLERVSAGGGRDENLWGYVDHNNITGLNLDDPESAAKIVKTWDDRLDMEVYCDSGVDDQMIIHIPFIHSLRLRSLLILPPQPTHPSRPRRIRLYTNLPQPPSFSDIEAMKPVQELDVAQSPSSSAATGGPIAATGDGGGGRRDVEEWPLKVQKMASVWSVTLMISDSEAGDRSRLYYLGFKGESRAPTKQEIEGGQVAAENAADAPVDRLAEKKGAGQTQIR